MLQSVLGLYCIRTQVLHIVNPTTQSQSLLLQKQQLLQIGSEAGEALAQEEFIKHWHRLKQLQFFFFVLSSTQ